MYDPMTDSRLEDIESYKGRLLAFLKMDNATNFNNLSILEPGSALGGELFAARELGAREVTGLEVIRELVFESEKYSQAKEMTGVFFWSSMGENFQVVGLTLCFPVMLLNIAPTGENI